MSVGSQARVQRRSVRTARDVASAAPLELPAGVLVIADLHLDPLGDSRDEGFIRWLEGLDTPGLVILGDLFDAWVGPQQARLPGAARVFDALAAFTARGARLHVVPGNRDFLLDADFERRTGARLHAVGLRARVGDTRYLLVHGDELCTADRDYQRAKRVLRSGLLRRAAPWVPLPVGRWVAGRLRRASQRAVPRKPNATKAMQPAAAEAVVRAADVDCMVCGHAHVYRDEPLPAGERWIVLDGWDGARDSLRLDLDGPDADRHQRWSRD